MDYGPRPMFHLASIAPLGSLDVTESPRAIDEGFPFEWLSDIAEAESWRKEVFRPIYHPHKWWAQRLGSVFRAAIIASAVPRGTPVLDYFWQPISLDGLVVFDPFMGSGTTVGEAHKLGCTAIGRDINPVAYRAVCAALGPADRKTIAESFGQLERTVGTKLRRFYQSRDSRGNRCDVLYYFWVKCNVSRARTATPRWTCSRGTSLPGTPIGPRAGRISSFVLDAETSFPSARMKQSPDVANAGCASTRTRDRLGTPRPSALPASMSFRWPSQHGRRVSRRRIGCMQSWSYVTTVPRSICLSVLRTSSCLSVSGRN